MVQVQGFPQYSYSYCQNKIPKAVLNTKTKAGDSKVLGLLLLGSCNQNSLVLVLKQA